MDSTYGEGIKQKVEDHSVGNIADCAQIFVGKEFEDTEFQNEQIQECIASATREGDINNDGNGDNGDNGDGVDCEDCIRIFLEALDAEDEALVTAVIEAFNCEELSTDTIEALDIQLEIANLSVEGEAAATDLIDCLLRALV